MKQLPAQKSHICLHGACQNILRAFKNGFFYLIWQNTKMTYCWSDRIFGKLSFWLKS